MRKPVNLWPLGLICVFGLFLSGTLGIILLTSLQRVDLVSSDYYEQELAFQKQIDRAARTRQLGVRASVTYNAAENHIVISLPPEQAQRRLSGLIRLYRPSQANLDREVKLEPDPNGIQRLDAGGLLPGLWKVRVLWRAQELDYFIDQPVVIGPPRNATSKPRASTECSGSDRRTKWLIASRIRTSGGGGPANLQPSPRDSREGLWAAERLPVYLGAQVA